MVRKRDLESGQVLIILTVGIIALLGFTALAIDGGMLYADRRYDQNSADNAAMDGAGAAAKEFVNGGVDLASFDCDDADVDDAIAAAYEAVENSAVEFILAGDHDISDGNGVLVECKDDGGVTGNYLLITVKFTSTTNTSFAQLIFSKELQNTVQAVTRIEPGVNDPPGPTMDGMGLVALADDDDSAIFGNGNSDLTVIGSGIHTNSGFTGKNVNIVSDLGVRYIPDYNHEAKKITCLDSEGKPTTNVATCVKPAEGKYELSIPGFPEACNAAGMTNKSSPSNKGGTISPGRYNGIKVTSGDLVMNPGLYCISGTVDLKGKVTVSGSENDGVTIYYTGSSWTLNGNAETNLRAPRHGATGSGLAIPGLLIYAPNPATVKWNGGSENYFRGTLAFPQSDVTLNGNTESGAWAAQFIGDTFKFTGGMSLRLDFTEDDTYWDAGELSLPLLDVYQ